MKFKNRQSGYTLVELLVVIFIIALLTGLGASIYAQSQSVGKVRNLAYDLQGMIMKAQSLAKAPSEANVFGYQIQVNTNSNPDQVALYQLKFDEGIDVNDVEPGSISPSDLEISPEPISEIYFDDNVVLDHFILGNYTPGGMLNVETITALAPRGRLIVNQREPDLDQDEDNLYNPLNTLPLTGTVTLHATVKHNGSDNDYVRYVTIDLDTGNITVSGD
jgi:prepilin-type N-terminal cleavage/methylation domain-containing protein